MASPHPGRRRFLHVSLAVAGLSYLTACGVSALWTARQPSPRLVGHLWAANVTPELMQAFRTHLSDLGHAVGQTVVIEDRVAGGRLDLLAGLVTELIRMPVEVIVTTGTPATLAASEATSTIPIVQASGTVDLVREGLAASHARPGGNVTGLGAIVEELTGKQLDLLRQTVPGLRKVAVLWNPTSPSTQYAWTETQTAARTLGMDVHSLEVRSPEHLESAVASARGANADVLLVLIDALTAAHRSGIAAIAQRHRLPSMFDRREFAVDGGLLAYGPNFVDMHRRAADYVDRILKGTRAAELPIERPSKFDFAVNVRTASTLGITVPPAILVQATEVIQ